jgi:branched-chain amino acid transport system substrate-binding protein
MNKIYTVVGVLAILAFCVIALMGQSDLNKNQDQRIIKIGVIAPLTGNQAFVGEGLKNSIILAQEDLSKRKELGEKIKFEYQVIFEDCQFDQKLAVSAAQKLINTDKVDVILDAYAPIGNAVSPITEKNGVVHISVAFDPKIANGQYNFLLFMTPRTVSKVFLEELQKRNIKNIAIVRINNEGIHSVFQAIQDMEKDYGVTVVSDEMFQPGEKDFRSIIAKTVVTKPDIYVLLTISPELEILTRQFNEYGIKNLTTALYFDIAQDKSLFKNLWFSGYAPLEDSSFEERYKERFGREVTFGVPNFYDAFSLIVDVGEKYNQDDKPSREYIAEELNKTLNFKGVLGNLTSDSDGIIDTPAAIKMFANESIVFIR